MRKRRLAPRGKRLRSAFFLGSFESGDGALSSLIDTARPPASSIGWTIRLPLDNSSGSFAKQTGCAGDSWPSLRSVGVYCNGMMFILLDLVIGLPRTSLSA